jgi:hypothetical protein
MTSPARKFAGRIAVAVLLVMLAAGSVFAAAATLPAAAGPNLAEPAATASPRADKSPKPEKSPDAARAADAAEAADADGAPSPANLDRIVARLKAAGITTVAGITITADYLAELAAKVGVGGAVRALLFAKASGLAPDAILALFESGKGWGVIARELKLTIGPGNGSVMGQGHGRDTAAKAADRAARAAAKTARIAERARQKAGTGD